MDKGNAIPTRSMADVSILEQDESQSAKRQAPYLKKFVPPDSDEEEIEKDEKLYNVNESWRTLISLPSCQRAMITEPVQQLLDLRVGINVTQEFPWKHIKYSDLREHLFDELENGNELQNLFGNFPPDYYVLIGFAPILTEQNEDPPEGDPFIFYSSSRDAKMAMGIIQNMEAFDRWRLNRRLRKKPRAWVSFGTEDELNILLKPRTDEPVDVEIQSVYPIRQPPHVPFKFRFSKDVRDGYIELLPNENVKYDNVTRKRITIGVQSAPAVISREQQTNPTFPTNAWSQYLYELEDADLALDPSEDEVEEGKELEALKNRQAAKKDDEEKEKPPPELSNQVKLLLNILELNQIDSYRDDYQYISITGVDHYTNPYLEEYLCFANISKSNKRFVSSCDWYPKLSGLVAVSYAFSTPATVKEASQRIDMVQRAVLQPNPILLWSFSDNLNYKLEFESPFETVCLSFCPYNADILLGGSKNGQVVIWDLQGRAERLDKEEYLTAAQAKYRLLIAEFLKWTIETTEDTVIPPATMTPLENSPKDAITGIYWLSERCYINNMGKLYTDPDEKKRYMFFVTCAFDGTISFWDLSGSSKKQAAAMRARNLPKELTANESAYKGRTIKPIYNLGFNEPITSIIGDTAVFACQTPTIREIKINPNNYPTQIIAKNPPQVRQSMLVSTFYGHIHRIDWVGMYTDIDAKETVNSTHRFAMVHDGPVIKMCKNPFYPNLFASIGRTIFAIWKDDYNYSPIFWRKRPCDLTAVSWSEARPAVLFITRIDGVLEAWDILARDDDACLSEVLGGGFISTITEHKPSLPHKILGIGDYNSSIRMVKLPPSFDIPLSNELQKVIDYVESEERRKTSIQVWEQKYYENNKDIIEAKREAEVEARKEMERREREEQARQRASGESEKNVPETGKTGGLNYPERMARQWDELNLNRMMTILMSRKQMDPEKLARQTALEKERLAFDAAKKESLQQTLVTIAEEIATVRSRILPAEVPDMKRSEMIQARVKEELELADTYESVCEYANETLSKFQDFDHIDYIEFLERGRHRRQLLNQSLGGNTERLLWYERMNRSYQLHECNWGYDFLFTVREKEGNDDDNDIHRMRGAPSDILHFDTPSKQDTPKDQSTKTTSESQ